MQKSIFSNGKPKKWKKKEKKNPAKCSVRIFLPDLKLRVTMVNL